MTNLDYWNTFVGEDSPETFMRNYGSADPELCVARFLEERGQLYGVVNQSTWVTTFSMLDQHNCVSVKVYLLSYLDETREVWLPALEANPPATPRRYREKFDQERYPPPGTSDNEFGTEEESGTYGTYVPSDHDFGDDSLAEPGPVEENDTEPSVVTPNLAEVEEVLVHQPNDPPVIDVVVPDAESLIEGTDGPQRETEREH